MARIKQSLPKSLFKAIFKQAGSAMIVLDDRGFIVEANPAACKLLNIRKKKLLGSLRDNFINSSWAKQPVNHQGEMQLKQPSGTIKNLTYRYVSHLPPHYCLLVLHAIPDEQQAIA